MEWCHLMTISNTQNICKFGHRRLGPSWQHGTYLSTPTWFMHMPQGEASLPPSYLHQTSESKCRIMPKWVNDQPCKEQNTHYMHMLLETNSTVFHRMHCLHNVYIYMACIILCHHDSLHVTYTINISRSILSSSPLAPSPLKRNSHHLRPFRCFGGSRLFRYLDMAGAWTELQLWNIMKWRNSVSQQTYPAAIKIQIPSNIRKFCRLQSLQVEKLIQISFSDMLSFHVVFPCLRVEYFKFGLGARASFRDFLRAPKGFGW